MVSGLLDTNVLVLLVIGAASEDFVSRHPLTKSDFQKRDYAKLIALISQFEQIEVTPHVLAETNSLIRKKVDGVMRDQIMASFNLFIRACVETSDRTIIATTSEFFGKSGLTDAFILQLVSSAQPQRGVITMDNELYSIAQTFNTNSVNFRHIQQRR
jgi:hypothetical protein